MMGLDLSYLPTVITSRVWDCNVDLILALYVSWLKHPIENNSNHVLDSGLELWTSSNGVVIFRPNRPGTWLSIIAAWRTAKYQKSLPTCFYAMNALAICIKVRHVRLANLFEDWRLEGAAILLEPSKRIHSRAFPLINFLSKSE